MWIGQTRGPAAGLEALRIRRVQHHVRRNVEIQTEGRREVIEVLYERAGRTQGVIGVGFSGHRKSEHLLARKAGWRTQIIGRRRIGTTRDLVAQAVIVGLEALEL